MSKVPVRVVCRKCGYVIITLTTRLPWVDMKRFLIFHKITKCPNCGRELDLDHPEIKIKLAS